jgi:O-antigen/teichoic acid export membrane protein
MRVPPTAAQEEVIEASLAGGRALRGGALRGGGYAAGILLSLASAPLLVRHLGVVGFGEYITAASIVTIVLGLTEGGLNAVALREFSVLHGHPRRQLMRNALGARLALTSVGVVAAIGFTAVMFGVTLALGVTLAGIGLILQLTQSVLSVPLQSELLLGRASMADLVRQIVSVTLIVVLVLAGADVVELLAVAIPASATSLALTAVMVRHLTPLRPAFHPRAWWSLLRDSIPYAAAIAMNVIYFRIAIILTSIFSTQTETGYFATSFRIMEALIGFPVLIVGAAFPLLARAERDDSRRFTLGTQRLFELSVLFGTLMVVVVEAGAPFAIRVLAGDAANPSITVLRIQALAIVATFVNVACAFPLLSMRRYRDLLVSNVVAFSTSAILVVALVKPLGANGAAIAATTGEVGLAATVAFLLVRRIPTVRLPFGAIVVAALCGSLAVVATLATPVRPLVQTVEVGVIYLAALRLAGRFPPETRRLLEGLRWESVR